MQMKQEQISTGTTLRFFAKYRLALITSLWSSRSSHKTCSALRSKFSNACHDMSCHVFILNKQIMSLSNTSGIMFKINYDLNSFPTAFADLSGFWGHRPHRGILPANTTAQVHAFPLTSKCTTGEPQTAEHQLHSENEEHCSACYLRALLP
jgi:hypothetical protein